MRRMRKHRRRGRRRAYVVPLCCRTWTVTNFHLRRNIVYCDNWMTWPPAKTRRRLDLPCLGVLASERHFLGYVDPLGQTKDANRYFTVGRGPRSHWLIEATKWPSAVYAKQHCASCRPPGCNRPGAKCVEPVPHGRRLNLRCEVHGIKSRLTWYSWAQRNHLLSLVRNNSLGEVPEQCDKVV